MIFDEPFDDQTNPLHVRILANDTLAPYFISILPNQDRKTIQVILDSGPSCYVEGSHAVIKWFRLASSHLDSYGISVVPPERFIHGAFTHLARYLVSRSDFAFGEVGQFSLVESAIRLHRMFLLSPNIDTNQSTMQHFIPMCNYVIGPNGSKISTPIVQGHVYVSPTRAFVLSGRLTSVERISALHNLLTDNYQVNPNVVNVALPVAAAQFTSNSSFHVFQNNIRLTTLQHVVGPGSTVTKLVPQDAFAGEAVFFNVMNMDCRVVFSLHAVGSVIANGVFVPMRATDIYVVTESRVGGTIHLKPTRLWLGLVYTITPQVLESARDRQIYRTHIEALCQIRVCYHVYVRYTRHRDEAERGSAPMQLLIVTLQRGVGTVSTEHHRLDLVHVAPILNLYNAIINMNNLAGIMKLESGLSFAGFIGRVLADLSLH